MRERLPGARKSPIVFISVVLILNCAVMMWLGWNSWSYYRKARITMGRDLKVEELRGVILHLDEVLTMSARMAAATGDLGWEERYLAFEPRLDAAIKQAMELAPEAYSGEAAVKTDEANIKLVEMEHQAFDLVRQGRAGEAREVLFGDEYRQQKQIYSGGMMRFAQHRDRYLRLVELRSAILHLDEVLTMSARMAAVTGDLAWEERYREFEPRLDAAIKEAMQLAPGVHSGEAAAQTDAANMKLVEIENQAFDLVRQGSVAEAGEILFSEEYEAQKQVYAGGMDTFAEGLSAAAAASLKRVQRSTFLHAGVLAILIPLAALGWFVVFRATRNWQAALTGNNRRLARQAEELTDLNRSLDQKVAERTQQLKESSAKYRALFESSRDAVMLLDRDGFIDCNPATLELFRCRSRDEFISKHPSDLSPPKQPEGKDSFIAAVEHIETAYETGKDFFEWVHERSNGAPFPATVHLSRIQYDGHDLLQALVRDISEQKWMEKALADEKERLSVTLQSIGDGVIATNRDGYVVSLNRAAEDLTGWWEREAIGMPLDKVFLIVDERTRERCEDPVQKVLATGKTVELSNHTILISKDGTERFLGDSAAPIRDRDGRIVGAVLVFRDVTEARKARQALKRHAHDLGGRVKELSCLYTISRLVEKRDTSLGDILQGTADVIPPSWQYPEVTCARVTLDGQMFDTDNLDETAWKMTSDIQVHGERHGSVEVYYLEERPESDEGPFLKEERNLIDAIAERLGSIVECHRAEEALALAADQWQGTFDAIRDMVVVLDRDFRVVRANQAVLDAFPDREVIGAHCYELYHGSESPIDRCPSVETFRAGSTTSIELHVEGPDDRWLAVSAYPITNDNGEIHQVVHTVRDVTKRRQAEQAIRESEEKYRTLFEGAADGILIVDVETTRLVHGNEAVCRMLGYTEEELIKLTVSNLHPKDALERATADFEAVARGEKSLAGDIPCLRKDGTVVYVDISAASVTVDGRECIVGFFRDITERKRMERELSQGQKLKAVGRLAAGIAHEINTPTQYVGDNVRFLQDSFGELANVMEKCGNLCRAREKGEVTPELVAEVGAAAKEVDMDYLKKEIPNAFKESLAGVERVSTIVRAMKEFSHPGGEEKVPTDINRAIDSTIIVARNEWKYVADLETEFAPELPSVPCVVGDFNQVILNMIVNAAHAVAEVVGDGSTGKGKMKISTRCEGDWVDIRISDTGSGIPKDVRSRIFEPFFTTKEMGKGTGQGLAIAHDVIVEKHGGSLTFETEEGKGTTFIIRLPLEASTS